MNVIRSSKAHSAMDLLHYLSLHIGTGNKGLDSPGGLSVVYVIKKIEFFYT
jgi:hypothetical protein